MPLSEAFTNPIFRDPLIAGAALAAACSLFSVLIVVKRLAFIGQGITHAGFGGVGLASFLALSGLARDAVVFVFCMLTGFAIGYLSRNRRLKSDTAIGIMLVATMGLGFLLDQARLHITSGWYRSLIGGRALEPTLWHDLLFGSIAFIRTPDMWLCIVSAVVVIAVLASLFKEIVFYAFDEQVCQVYGIPATTLHYLMLGVLAALIVVTMKLVGLLLVTAFLIVPGATALMLSRRLKTVLILSVIVGEVGMIGGYLLAMATFKADLAPGPFIVLVLAAEFALAFIWTHRAQ